MMNAATSSPAAPLLVTLLPCLQVRSCPSRCCIPAWGHRLLCNHPHRGHYQATQLCELGIVDSVPVILWCMQIWKLKPRANRVRDNSLFGQCQIIAARIECIAESWMAVHLHAGELACFLKNLSQVGILKSGHCGLVLVAALRPIGPP